MYKLVSAWSKFSSNRNFRV